MYNPNLDIFEYAGKQYLSIIDQLFSNQKKFWILTNIWDYNTDIWKLEAIALEMKNCLDRNMLITIFYQSNPPIEQGWLLMLKAIELYESGRLTMKPMFTVETF